MTDVLTVVGDEGDGEAAGGVVAVGSELNPQLGGASSEGGGRGQAATRLEGDPTIGRLCRHTQDSVTMATLPWSVKLWYQYSLLLHQTLATRLSCPQVN